MGAKKKAAKKRPVHIICTSDSYEAQLDAIRIELMDFCKAHGVTLYEKAECGFGRPCVGIMDAGGGNYVDHNPHQAPDYDPIAEFEDPRLYAPEGVNAYHKHECLAVLITGSEEDMDGYDTAIRQLHRWIQNIETEGEVEIVEYDRYAEGHVVNPIQMLISPPKGWAIRFKEGRKEIPKLTVGKIVAWCEGHKFNTFSYGVGDDEEGSIETDVVVLRVDAVHYRSGKERRYEGPTFKACVEQAAADSDQEK